MKLLMLTAYDNGYAKIGDLSVQNKIRYCERHNYAFLSIRDGFDASRPASWSKINFIRQHLPAYDWIFWTDADSLVMNHKVRLERFIDDSFDFIWCCENAGQFFIRKCDWAFSFLDEVYRQVQFINHVWWENQAIVHLMKTRKHISTRMKTLDVHAENFNTFYERYAPGDFILHFPGRVDREALMHKYFNIPPLTDCVERT